MTGARLATALLLLEAMMSDAQAKVKLLPSVSVTAPPSVLAGFPLVAAVTLHNDEPGSDYYGLPDADLFDDEIPFDLTFTDEQGRKKVVKGAAASFEDKSADGLALMGKQDHTMLVHLPVEQLPPGRYQVQLAYTHEGARARAAPFPLRVEAPSAEDAATAAKLRAMVDQGSPSWAGFLARNWRTVNATHLSPAGRKALALHLFLHRAIYGPDEPAQLDEQPLQGIGSAEAALVRVELLAARNDPRLASEQTALLARYPGLAWRVAEIAAGNGELTRAREVYGAGVKIEGRKTPYREK